MEELYDRCCGLDVHRDPVTACIMIGYGAQKRKIIETFPTFTQDIKTLADRLSSLGIKQVAIESTGIYWKPIFLENANIKLSSVFSDVFGLTPWSMICKLVAGETDMKALTEFIDPRCKASKEEIEKALEGTLEEEDRDMLRIMMEHVALLEKLIATKDNEYTFAKRSTS